MLFVNAEAAAAAGFLFRPPRCRYKTSPRARPRHSHEAVFFIRAGP